MLKTILDVLDTNSRHTGFDLILTYVYTTQNVSTWAAINRHVHQANEKYEKGATVP